jgi:hypothetical protein
VQPNDRGRSLLARVGRSRLSRRWAVAIASAGLYVAAGWAAGGATGLTLSIAANTLNPAILDVRHVDTIDPAEIDAVPGIA